MARQLFQSEAAECGLVSLAICSQILGADVDLSDLRREFAISHRGLTLQQIVELASAMSLSTRGVRCELDELEQLSLPAILHWGMNHFVVLKAVRGDHITLVDPAYGERKIRLGEFSRKFTGIALEVSTAPGFKRRKVKSQLNILSLVRWTKPLSSTVAQVILLSLVVQIYVLAAPFYSQLVIDETVARGDLSLLNVLFVSFIGFAVMNLVGEILRGIALQRASSLISWDITGRLYRHLLKLPLPWFQRRRLADTLQRFDSLEPVRQLLSMGLAMAAIDVLLCVTTSIMMYLYSPKLMMVSVIGLLVFILSRVVLLPLNLRVGAEALVARIAEQGKRIETLRAIQSIKASGTELQRESDWSSKFALAIRREQDQATIDIATSSVERLIGTLVTMTIFFIAARSIVDGVLTVGALYAFMAYQRQFQDRSVGIFNTFVQWRLLDIHSDRIAEIVLAPEEHGITRPASSMPQIQGYVEARRLGFQYSPHDRPVFTGATFRILPGQVVAFVGPSGAGKTTLVKVLCGLYPSSTGEVLIDGTAISTLPPKGLRRQLGIVLQDDELLTGTIAQNVSLFDETLDHARLWECLEAAAIASEVRAMAMKAETFVGDMGASLSGGQKQRLMIARALYRRPRILIMDEATSHLDPAAEAKINLSLGKLEITRLIVAHRAETIKTADRVFVVSNGTVVEAAMEATPVAVE